MPGLGSARLTGIRRAAGVQGRIASAFCAGSGERILGPEPEAVPRYTFDWSEPGHTEDLLAAADRNLVAVDRAEAQAGDVLVFRMRDGSVAKHVGILARSQRGEKTLIHAYSGHGVVESPLTPAWSRRIAGVFRFPDGRV